MSYRNVTLTFGAGPVAVLMVSPRHLALAVLAIVVPLAIFLGFESLELRARLALAIFAMTLLGWTLSRIDDAVVALVGVIALALSGAVPEQRLYGALGNELTWLMIASFVIAAALRATGISERLVAFALRPTRTIGQLFHALALTIAATAFVIPSTSGRAAMFVPVFVTLAGAIGERRLVRALALLFPTAILLSAGGSLIGAGAHLVAADYLAMLTSGAPPGYLEWIVLALPFTLLSTTGATLVILHLFLSREERRRALVLPVAETVPPTPTARVTGLIVIGVTIVWATKPLHGIDLAIAGMVAALMLTSGPWRAITLKDAMRAVDWKLILFLAATMLLSETLVDSKAASHLIDRVLHAFTGDLRMHVGAVIAGVALTALLGHLLINSRTARAAALLPLIAIPLAQLGYDPYAVVMTIVLGTGFCQTLTSSAKPVAVFANADGAAISRRDLLLLSIALFPLHFALLWFFGLHVWARAA